MPAQSPARTRKPVATPQWDGKLRKHADYQRVYREGKRQSLPLMTYFFAARRPPKVAKNATAQNGMGTHPTELQHGSRVGLTTGRVLGNSVERNRIKRRMREAIRQAQVDLTANVDVILHPRRTVLEAEFSQIERDVVQAFRAVQVALTASCDADSSHGN